MIRISHWLPAMVSLLFGCSSGGDSPDPTMGSVSLALQSNGVELTTVTYTITGHGFTRISVVNVEHSTTISALIGGLPQGSYTITLEATDANDAATECTGSGSFEIAPQQTTSTRVNLYCRKSSNNGSVSISGEVLRCPTIQAVSAEPSEAKVGSTISFYALADDPELHFDYAWESDDQVHAHGAGRRTSQRADSVLWHAVPPRRRLHFDSGDPEPLQWRVMPRAGARMNGNAK